MAAEDRIATVHAGPGLASSTTAPGRTLALCSVIGPLEIALGLAPFAEDAIRSVISKNTVRNLMKLVETELRRSHRLPPGRHAQVAESWARQRVDPNLVGSLAAWLATGQDAFLEQAGARWGQLLAAGPDAAEFGIGELVDVAMQSARRNLARAQASDRDAVHAESEYTRQVVGAASDDVKEHITRELDRVEAASRTWRPDDLSLPRMEGVGKDVALRLVANVRQILERLAQVDDLAAKKLSDVWQTGGCTGIQELIKLPQSWTVDRAPEIWVAAGHIALLHNCPAVGCVAFGRAADDPRIADRAPQHVRASISAKLAGKHEEAAKQLSLALSLDPGHPSLALLEIRDEPDAERRLVALQGITPADEQQRTEVEIQRASALVVLGRHKDAQRILAEMEQRDPGSGATREAKARFALAECQDQKVKGNRPDRAASLTAARGFRELREDAHITTNFANEALFAALEASAWLLAEEHKDAHTVLEDMAAQLPFDAAIAADLAEVALQSHRPDLALVFCASA